LQKAIYQIQAKHTGNKALGDGDVINSRFSTSTHDQDHMYRDQDQMKNTPSTIKGLPTALFHSFCIVVTVVNHCKWKTNL